jgi:putative transposase
MRRTFKLQLYPSHRQPQTLQATLDVCRELYDAGPQERRDAWSGARQRIGYVAQPNQLGEIKSIRDDIAAVHGQVLQDVLRRLDKTFQAFFLRRNRRQKPGFPRFRSKAREQRMRAHTSAFCACLPARDCSASSGGICAMNQNGEQTPPSHPFLAS